MHHLSLERVEARNLGPSNIVELPPRGDQDMRRVLKRLSGGEVGDLDLPGAGQRPLQTLRSG